MGLIGRVDKRGEQVRAMSDAGLMAAYERTNGGPNNREAEASLAEIQRRTSTLEPVQCVIVPGSTASQIAEQFGTEWLADKPMDNRFDPKELRPFGRAYVVRNEVDRSGLDVMEWDVLAGQAKQAGRKVAQTDVRTLHLPQWRSLVTEPANRCLIR